MTGGTRGLQASGETLSRLQLARAELLSLGAPDPTLLSSNHSCLCVTLGKPLHLSVSWLLCNILIADINVYLLKSF